MTGAVVLEPVWDLAKLLAAMNGLSPLYTALLELFGVGFGLLVVVNVLFWLARGDAAASGNTVAAAPPTLNAESGIPGDLYAHLIVQRSSPIDLLDCNVRVESVQRIERGSYRALPGRGAALQWGGLEKPKDATGTLLDIKDSRPHRCDVAFDAPNDPMKWRLRTEDSRAEGPYVGGWFRVGLSVVCEAQGRSITENKAFLLGYHPKDAPAPVEFEPWELRGEQTRLATATVPHGYYGVLWIETVNPNRPELLGDVEHTPRCPLDCTPARFQDKGKQLHTLNPQHHRVPAEGRLYCDTCEKPIPFSPPQECGTVWDARDAALAQIRGQLSRWAAATPPAPK